MKAEKALYVLPEYTLPNFNLLMKLVGTRIKEIDIAAPYNVESKVLKFVFRRNRKYQSRLSAWRAMKEKTAGSIKVTAVYLKWYYVLVYLLRHRISEKKQFYYFNSLRWIVEQRVINKIDFGEYKYLLCLDTAALAYQEKADQFGIIKILESRGCFIDFVTKMNLEINRRYHTSLPVEDDPGSSWWNKMRMEIANADVLSVYSHSHLKQFQNYAFYKGRYIIDTLPSRFPKSKKIKSVNGGIHFYYMGRVTPSKGINLLLKVWKDLEAEGRLKDSFLHIVGDRDDRFFEPGEIVDTASIVFRDRLSGSELNDFLENIVHVLVMPTFYDSFGMVVNEALSFNIPVITSVNCGASDLIKEKMGFVIENVFSEEDWKNCILTFVNNHDLVKNYSEHINSMGLEGEQNQFAVHFDHIINSIESERNPHANISIHR